MTGTSVTGPVTDPSASGELPRPARRSAPIRRRIQAPPGSAGLNAMATARQANGTAGSTYR